MILDSRSAPLLTAVAVLLAPWSALAGGPGPIEKPLAGARAPRSAEAYRGQQKAFPVRARTLSAAYKRTGDPAHLSLGKTDSLHAAAAGLRAKAATVKTGKKRVKLEKNARRLESKARQAVAGQKPAPGAEPGSAVEHAGQPQEEPAAAPGPAQPPAQVVRAIEQGALAHLKSGNVVEALARLKQLQEGASLTAKAQKSILKQTYKLGKIALREGDIKSAKAAQEVFDRLKSSGDKRVHKLGNSAIWGAFKLARSGYGAQAKELLGLANDLQRLEGRSKNTLRYRVVRWVARRRATGDMELAAKQGNYEAFRSAKNLVLAYAEESGQPLSGKQTTKLDQLDVTARKNSVIRALHDAELVLSGKMGTNPEYARVLLEYAADTHADLAQKGIEVKTGLLRRGVGSQIARLRGRLAKVERENGPREVKRPGLVKSILQALFVAPHRRAQPPIMEPPAAWQEAVEKRKVENQVREVLRQQNGGVAPSEEDVQSAMEQALGLREAEAFGLGPVAAHQPSPRASARRGDLPNVVKAAQQTARAAQTGQVAR